MSEEETGRRGDGTNLTARPALIADVDLSLIPGRPAPPDSPASGADPARLRNRSVPIWLVIILVLGALGAGAAPALMRDAMAEPGRAGAPGTLHLAWGSIPSTCTSLFGPTGTYVRAGTGRAQKRIFILDAVAQPSTLGASNLLSLQASGLKVFPIAPGSCDSEEGRTWVQESAAQFLDTGDVLNFTSVPLTDSGWASATLMFVIDCEKIDTSSAQPLPDLPITAVVGDSPNQVSADRNGNVRPMPNPSSHSVPLSLEPFLANVLSSRLRECPRPS